jgi:hypothetical protein
MTDITQWPHNGLPPPANPIVYTEDEILTFVKATQIEILTASCGAAIVSGFSSSALGTAYTYPSKQNDQINLIGAVTSGESVDFWNCDSAGVWAKRPHTAAQIKQVLSDGKASYQSYSAKLIDLTNIVNAAATVEEVQAVVW